MLDNVSNKLAAQASGKNLLGLLALGLLFYAGFSKRGNRLRELSGGIGGFDARFSYTPETAYHDIAAFGEEGRHEYAVTELTLDLGFPLLYPTFLSLLISYLLRRAWPGNNGIQKLNLIPFLAMPFDYAENFSIVALLRAFPRRLDSLARAANCFTRGKWSASYASIGIIIVGTVAWVAKGVNGLLRKNG